MGIVYGDKVPGKIPAIYRIHRRKQLPVAAGIEFNTVITDELEGDIRVGHSYLLKDIADCICLCYVLFHKLLPCRHIVEQVSYDDSGTVGAASLFVGDLYAALNVIEGTVYLITLLCHDLYP